MTAPSRRRSQPAGRGGTEICRLGQLCPGGDEQNASDGAGNVRPRGQEGVQGAGEGESVPRLAGHDYGPPERASGTRKWAGGAAEPDRSGAWRPASPGALHGLRVTSPGRQLGATWGAGPRAAWRDPDGTRAGKSSPQRCSETKEPSSKGLQGGTAGRSTRRLQHPPGPAASLGQFSVRGGTGEPPVPPGCHSPRGHEACAQFSQGGGWACPG